MKSFRLFMFAVFFALAACRAPLKSGLVAHTADDSTPECPAVEDKDTDGDGILDSQDEDDDNDGVNDSEDQDHDNDGIADSEDEDDDNDGAPDSEDQDDDNDGITDTCEGQQ